MTLPGSRYLFLSKVSVRVGRSTVGLIRPDLTKAKNFFLFLRAATWLNHLQWHTHNIRKEVYTYDGTSSDLFQVRPTSPHVLNIHAHIVRQISPPNSTQCTFPTLRGNCHFVCFFCKYATFVCYSLVNVRSRKSDTGPLFSALHNSFCALRFINYSDSCKEYVPWDPQNIDAAPHFASSLISS
jgi:hypothetical protein